jgi:AraC-like DNA-binding protein
MEILCQNNKFALFEELAAAVKGWSLDFTQLSNSQGTSFLQQIASPDMLFTRVKFSAKFEQCGGPTQSFRTFALMAPSCPPLKWCQQAITPRSLMVFPANGDFHSVSQPGFHMYTASVSQRLLERLANDYFQQDLQQLLPPERNVVHCHPSQSAKLRGLFLQLSQLPDKMKEGSKSENLNDKQLTAICFQQLEQEIGLQLLSSLNDNPSHWRKIKNSRRQRVLIQSLDVINNAAGKTLTVADLLENSDISLRTLEYAFLDHFSVTPKQYLKALRFRELHQQLLRSSPHQKKSVTEIVQMQGFRPSGQLSQEYAQFFGEQPSKTLKRS